MTNKTTTEKIKKSITMNSTLGIMITGMVVLKVKEQFKNMEKSALTLNTCKKC